MIRYQPVTSTYHLTTSSTEYVLYINEHNHVEHLYYGTVLNDPTKVLDYRITHEFEQGSATSYNDNAKGYMLDQVLLEASTYGKGDYRTPLFHITRDHAHNTFDFKVDSHHINTNYTIANLPQFKHDEALKLVLKDEASGVELHLYYGVLQQTNAIVRSTRIINNSNDVIYLEKAGSMQFDVLNANYDIIKLDGAWIKERHMTTHKLTQGTLRFDSKKGVSSANHNPFVVLKEEHTTNTSGNAYGFALVYSGNFEVELELNSHNVVRLIMGINSFDFRYMVKQGKSFDTPQVILTYSNNGLNQLSQSFHDSVNEYLISNNSKKERPIMMNNWEATYFDFNEKKLKAIAKQASRLGMECLCVDDGWFLGRNDDTSSLGDWQVDKKKLPNGLSYISKYVHKLGLQFGLWVEPEMVNKESTLYKTHPEWVLMCPDQSPALGRNQLILDCTNEAVQSFIINTVSRLITEGNIDYIKWDMNRNFSDIYSNYLDPITQQAYNYHYVVGLYRILNELTILHPDVLFESCSSGGNRYDLGMLYYMPQTWTSDNTDGFERIAIQEGTSLLYPLSSMSNHVSSSVSHQVFRHTPLETRFHVACFGVLGYELDITILTPFQKKVITKQIAFYKQHRLLFQQGTFHRLDTFDDNTISWMVTNNDLSKAIVMYYQIHNSPNPPRKMLRIPGLKCETKYHITNRLQFMNIKEFGSLVNEALPIKLKVDHWLHNIVANRYLFESETISVDKYGKELQEVGLLLQQQFSGTGYNENIMMLQDFSTRLFILTEE